MEISIEPKSAESVTHGTANSYQKSIEELAREIELRSDFGDAKLIETAMLVKQLKTRIEAGEVGLGIRWLVWAKDRFKRRKSQLYKLITVANASDPRQALSDFRVRENLRQKKRRMALSENGTECNPDRIAVMKIIRTMSPSNIRRVHKYICDLTGA